MNWFGEKEIKNISLFSWESLWLLKCCKNKNSYNMKLYFHSIKITLYLIKYIFIISSFFQDIKIYFYSIKINLYSIKYIFIISTFFFNDIKIYFCSVKINLYSVRYIFIIHTFSHSNKLYFSYMNFSLSTFLVSMSGLSFVFTKVRVLLSVCKLNDSTRVWKSW